MISANVIQRVFNLKYQNQTGTCFTIEIDTKQYFVTAKHVLQIKDEKGLIGQQLQSNDTVEILRDGRWTEQKVLNVSHSEVSDVSIFTIGVIIEAPQMLTETTGIFYGQDLYFLGFPYGLNSIVGEVNRNFPLPFVKKGILSSMFNAELGGMFFTDGHNNPGFSGGPVVFMDQADKKFKVAGVIHGFKPEFKMKDGYLVPIENSNSNIIVAYSIDNAVKLIKNL